MKLDDRDIVCEQDYTPLSNAELLTQIEQHTAIMYTSPIIDFDLEWITGPARALLARVEAAEVERNTAARRAFNAEAENQRLTAENRRLAARVAELETKLAAQGWRPVTEEPIEDEYYLTYDALLPGNEPWIVNYYSRTQGWANCCSAWLCPPPKPPRPSPPAPQETTQ